MNETEYQLLPSKEDKELNIRLVKQSKGIEDIHNYWLYCFTNSLELGETRIPSSRGFVEQYNQELFISPITRCFIKRL